MRFAFHPIIRLAYGVRFGIESEVSAGLAYLACAGPDDALQALPWNKYSFVALAVSGAQQPATAKSRLACAAHR